VATLRGAKRSKRFGDLPVTTLPWWDSLSFIRPSLHA